MRNLRESLGLSQEGFAHEVGASVGTISRWERGQKAQLTIPQAKAMDKLLESLGMRFSDLNDDLSINSASA